MKTTNIRYETWNTKGKKARWRQQSFSKRMIPLLVFQTENYQQLHTALRMCSRYLFLTISGKYNEQQNSQAFVAFHSFLSLSLSGVLNFFSLSLSPLFHWQFRPLLLLYFVRCFFFCWNYSESSQSVCNVHCTEHYRVRIDALSSPRLCNTVVVLWNIFFFSCCELICEDHRARHSNWCKHFGLFIHLLSHDISFTPTQSSHLIIRCRRYIFTTVRVLVFCFAALAWIELSKEKEKKT